MGENTGKHVICEKGKRIVAESSGFVRATHGQKVIRKQFRFRFFRFHSIYRKRLTLEVEIGKMLSVLSVYFTG